MSRRPYKSVADIEFLYGTFKYMKFKDIPLYYLVQEMNKGMFNSQKYARNVRIRNYINERIEKEKNPINNDVGYISFD